MTQTVGDYLIQRLVDWGIDRVYGYPGDGINGFMGALGRADEEEIQFLQVRHEEEAAFMACAHAKFTGEVGVCMATSGPGAVHLLNGLYDAKKDHVPVLAIVGQQARYGLGSDYQQEVDLISLYKDVAHQYVQQASVPAQTRHMVDQSVRVARAHRAVTCIIFPNELQEEEMEQAPRKHGSTFSGIGYQPPRVVPEEQDLERAADVLNEGERVAMLVGAGVRNAVDEVMEVADVLGAGVAKALLGKCTLSDDLPYVTGAIGLLGTEASDTMMRNCDTLLMVGTNFPYAEFLPEEDQARGVQIDIEGSRLGVRFPTEVNLQGDAADTLEALELLLDHKEDRSWRQRIEQNVSNWWETVESRAMMAADPINPQRVIWELSDRLPNDAIVTADSGSVANWYARQLKVPRGVDGSLSGGMATMCPAVPYATAAKYCCPDRPVFALVGDGAMQMMGNSALITASKYWQNWDDPRLIVLVLNNQDLNQVTWEQRVMEGDPRYEASQEIPDFAYDEYAESLGFTGLRMESPEEVGPVWDRAVEAERPVVINAYTDPDVPPLPPHISFEQARNYSVSLVKESQVLGEIKQTLKGVTAKFLGTGDASD